MTVIFDDKCQKCLIFRKFIEFVDLQNKIRFIALSKVDIDKEVSGLSLSMANSLMAGYKKNNWTYGFRTIVNLTSTVLLLYPLYPILFFMYKINVGDKLYREISNNRYLNQKYCQGSCNINKI